MDGSRKERMTQLTQYTFDFPLELIIENKKLHLVVELRYAILAPQDVELLGVTNLRQVLASGTAVPRDMPSWLRAWFLVEIPDSVLKQDLAERSEAGSGSSR